MRPVSDHGIEVDRCTGCGGLWLDALDERQLLSRKGSESLDTGDASVGASRDAQGKVDCPRCRTRMVRMVDREQPHIWFERCSVCGGTFLDAGELRDLAEHSVADAFRHWRKGARPLG
jgi:Zn-finger nucleic acid-binding protein